MTAIDTFARFGQRIPTLGLAHWALRVPLAAIIINQGLMKLPDFAGQAESYGLPLVLFALATFAELAGGAAILLGGLIRHWTGDVLTRLGGLATTIVVTGVIVMIYFGPWVGWQFQSLILAGGVYFMLRGNDT
ncbi:MAG: DoxX family membrane protein [Pseudomonadota bacterium]